MKKLILLFLYSIAVFATGFSQISLMSVPVEPKTTIVKYDSTRNFVGEDYFQLIGQKLYVNGKPDQLQKFGFSDFVIDYNKSGYSLKNTYKPAFPTDLKDYKVNGVKTKADSIMQKLAIKSYEQNIKYDIGGGTSEYDSLFGKYFEVIDVVKITQSSGRQEVFLKLLRIDNSDTVYYSYDSRFEHSFPFILVGFFERQKNNAIGKEFIFNDKWLEGSINIETGQPIINKTKQIWKCVDFSIEQKYYHFSIIIQNPSGEKLITSPDILEYRKGRVYTVQQFNNCKKKFGEDNMNKILQQIVRLGMTKEMCEFAWGEPDDINQTLMSGLKTEQWVYNSGSYLYFQNGILKTIQD